MSLREALALFDEIVELREAQREQHLAAVDAPVATLVRGMLRADRVSRRFATGIGGQILAGDLSRDPVETPESLPGYDIIAELGAGGMGRVFEAQQHRPSRRVAIKLIHPFLLSDRTRSWLRDEAEALATLLHPSIPQVYSIEEQDGQLFLVMEKVDGRPLHVAAHGAPLRQRVAWIAEIGDAVAHAHGRGLLHLDLKPDNVLVTPAGVPKVLDFGLARAVDSGRDDLIAGTAAYMPPEQRAGDRLDVRADVFALGRVLDELIGEGPADVQAIARQATRASPAERYRSMEAMVEDLRAFLAHRPVQARRGGTLYRLSCTLRRHPVPVVASAVVLLALIGATAFSTDRALRAEQARARADVALQEAVDAREQADREARRATATSDFLTEVFLKADPNQTTGERTLVDATRAALERLDAGELEHAPADAAALRLVIANALYGLNRLDEAEVQFQILVEQFETLPLAPDDTLVEALQSLAILERRRARGADYRERLDRAAELLDRATALARDLELPGRLADLLHTRAQVAYAGGDYLGASELFEQALREKRALYDQDRIEPYELTATLNQLGYTSMMTGRLERSQALYDDALGILRTHHDEPHPRIATGLHYLAQLAVARQDWDTALTRIDEAAAMRDALQIPDDAGGRRWEHQVRAQALAGLERWDDAEAELEEIYEGAWDRVEREDAWTLARIHLARGKREAAGAVIEQAVQLDIGAAEGTGAWAWAYTLRGRWRATVGEAGAEEDLRRALSVWERRFTEQGPRAVGLIALLEGLAD